MDKNLKNVLTILGIVAFALIVFGSGIFVGRSTIPNYANLYTDEKIKREGLEIVVRDLTGDNERLKADLQGGRSTAEEREGLEKRREELDRREKLLDQREDGLIVARVDLENKMNEFYATIGTTREEVGQAKQIKIDYEDTKNVLSETSKARDEAYRARDVWRNLVGILLFLIAIVSIPLALYILRLRFLKARAEKFIETLEAELGSSSVTVENIKVLAKTFSQLTNSSKPPKLLNSSDTPIG